MSFRAAALCCFVAVLCGCLHAPPRPPQEPPRAFVTDGCSAVPDFNFRDCCVAHDRAYWRGGSCAERRDADAALAQCIADHGHRVLAGLYHVGVRLGGAPWWPLPWRWGFGWPYGVGYSESCSPTRP